MAETASTVVASAWRGRPSEVAQGSVMGVAAAAAWTSVAAALAWCGRPAEVQGAGVRDGCGGGSMDEVLHAWDWRS